MHDDVTRLVGACLAVSEQTQAIHHRLGNVTFDADGSAWNRLKEMDELTERLRCLNQALEGAVYAWTCPN